MSCSRGYPLPDSQQVSIRLETQTMPSETASLTPTPSETATLIPTASPTAKPSDTPTPIASVTPSLTPTPEGPVFKISMQANCRYGPGTAYLYSHGLYNGDSALVDGRNYSGSWLWIKPKDIERHCWVSASVGEVIGDISDVNYVQSRLPQSSLYDPPELVETARQGDRVVIEWEPVWMTEDDFRGYMIEANVCQGGGLTTIAVHTEDTAYEITDEKGCAVESGGKLYAVEKHGYTDPVPIPWP